MRWDFHGLTVEGLWDDAPIGERWLATFTSRPQAGASSRSPLQPPSDLAGASAPPSDLVFRLTLADEAPPAPPSPPNFRQGDLLAYYLDGAHVTAHFPRFGQLQLDLARGAITGVITRAALATYGVFEDLLAIGLSPHFRRRGLFLLHAFAAVSPPLPPLARNQPLPIRARVNPHRGGAAILLVGDIGSGKTTTGLALLHAGWKLLSNDSPILTLTPHSISNSNSPSVLSYPGLLSAYPDTLTRFPELASLAAPNTERQKTLFAAEAIYPDVWVDSARPAAIIFPQIESRPDHTLEKLRPAEALPLLLPHAVEPWDREMIPAHLALLKQFVETVPAYRLRLGPDVNAIPALLLSTIDRRRYGWSSRRRSE